MSPERSFTRMPAAKSNPYFIPVFILSFSLLVCCEKEPAPMGRDLIPDSIHVFIDTTELIYSTTITGDSLATNNKSIQLFGHRTDPMFGISISELVTEITLIRHDTFSFGNNPRADSVIFTLSFTGYSGDPESSVEIILFEYTERIETDTNVYSNKDISDKYNTAPLGSGFINFTDSVLKVNLTNEDFIQKFFVADDTIFTNNEYLIQYMHGLYLHPETRSSEGAIFTTDFSQNPGLLSFYYSNDEEDSLSYHFEIGTYSGRFSVYNHNYQGFPVNDFLIGGNENDSLVFLQSMAGVNGIIRLPELESWLDSIPVAINNAKLIITPADPKITGLNPDEYPQSLNMYLVNPEGGYLYVFDYLINTDTYGGEYDSESNSYTFNIGFHIQSYLKGNVDNLDLIIIPKNPSEDFRQVILNGAKNQGEDRMKIEIVYTPL